MVILKGTDVAEKIRKKVGQKSQEFQKKHGRPPGLAVVIVGDDPASHVYVRNKIKACEDSGIRSFHHPLPDNTSQEVLIRLIQDLNIKADVDGILVQLPLPKSLNSDAVIEAISPKKDADGLTIDSMGRLFAGKPRVSPCTPAGVMEILEHYDIPVAGKNVCVVGRSQIVGRPMAQLMLMKDATVTVCHSKTPNVRAVTSVADIVVVAAGKPRFMGKDDFKKGAVVVDVGIHRESGKLCGDVRFEELENHVHAATPVPGGVGPMTIAMLLLNTLRLAEMSKGH